VRNLRLILPLLAGLLPAVLPAAAPAARTPVASPRIINGHAPTQAWPAQTSVAFTTSSGSYVCGGTLVSARWVLTAAHCVTNNDNSVLAASAFSLRVGSTRRTTGGNTSTVDQVKRYPFYSPAALSNDLALLHLVSAAPQEPMRIVSSGSSESALWASGVQATVVGWGVTETGSQATNLVEAQVPMVSDGSCSTAWGSSFKVGSMVCAGGATIDTCGGDSGGPLMVPRNGAFTIVGVTSWGSDACGTAGLPGVYARLGAATLNSWVRSFVPTAAISVATGTPAPAAQVTLSATAFPGAQTTTPALSWDLDNDGAFDDAVGATPTASFSTAGSHVVRVQAVYADGDRAVAREVVSVVDPSTPPTPATAPAPPPTTTTTTTTTATTTTPPASPATQPSQQLQQVLQQTADLAAPIGSVARPARIKLKTLRERGVRFSFSCQRACTVSANVTLNAATARRFGLGNGSRTMTIGRVSGSRGEAGDGTLSVRLSARAKRALRKATRFTLRLTTQLDGAGATPVKGSSRITISR
jgi:secreted trypsin-like serine protease